MTKSNSILIILIVLIILNLGYLNYKLFKPPEVQSTSNVSPETITEYIDQCGSECKNYIDEKIAVIKITSAPTAKAAITVAAPVRAKVQSTQFFPISVSGSVTNTEWTDISGSDFYFNTADYSGLKQIQFEATIRLFNGNGKVYVRLFDATHGIAVQGSQSEATGQSATVVTASPAVFWSGNNLIRVQLKSLTADTAIFDSGRLKIITEN
jgi:hypothetical protein